MKPKNILFALVCILIPALVLFTACSENPITDLDTTQPTSYSSDEINWIPWKAEYLEKLDKNALERVLVGQWIFADFGGFVGGWYTFNNMVSIPPGALLHNTYVSVEVLQTYWNYAQTGGGVEFLPSMQFQLPVSVSLSYAYLHYFGNPYDLAIYWTNDDGNSWYMVDDVFYNTFQQYATFQVDHFTVFAWGERAPSGE